MTSRAPDQAAAPARPACHFARSMLTASVLAALFPSIAIAQPAPELPDATQIDAVRVTGQREAGYGTDGSSTATRLALTPRETPQSVSAVGREQMDDFALDSVNDVLAASTGVTVEQVETDRTYYTARGFDITNFQRDGLGIPLPYGLQNGDLDTAFYERIETLRGANGLTSATGNPSATINFVRKRPTADLQGAFRVSAGSWDSLRVEGDVSGPLNGTGSVRGRAVAAWQKNDSYLDRYEREKQVAYGVVEADLGGTTTLIAGASWQQNQPNSPLWGAPPLYYTDGTPTGYDASVSTATDWAFWDTEDTRAFVELDHGFANGWSARMAFNHEQLAEGGEMFYVYGVPDRETGEGLFVYPSAYENDYTARSLDAYVTGPLQLGGRRHDVVLGAAWADGNTEDRSGYGEGIGNPLPRLDTWDGRYPRPSFDASFDGSSFDYGRKSLYATVRWNLAETFKLITGVNRTHVETRGITYGESVDAEETRTTPFVGAVVDLNPYLSAYGSYGEIFSQQPELDIDVRPVGTLSGSNAELGLKGEWMNGRFNVSAAVFRVEQDNLAAPAGFDIDTFRQYYRGADAQSQGLEIDVAGKLTPHWQVAGGYTRLSIEDEQGEDTRTYVPRQVLRVYTTVDVTQVPGLRLGASVRWQDDIAREQTLVLPDGNPLVIRQDSYALVGLMASYGFARNWQAALNIDNVTDEKYLSSLYWAEQGYYAPPRNVSLSLSYRF